MTAWIDGRALAPEPGETILAAARRVGIEIPTLCFLDGLPPDGGCRRCVVETEGRAALDAACHTPLVDGARVTTRSPRLERLRAELEALQAADLPRTPSDESHPYLRFDPSRCILCRRCVHVCREIPGRDVWHVAGPREAPRIACDGPAGLRESSCVACGACVDACPTGAISDRDRLDHPPPAARVRTTCGYCGVGCRLEVGVAERRVVRIDAVADAAVNRGALCAKGRYAHAWQGAPDRLTRPLLRRGGELTPVSWREAIAWAAARLDALQREHGPDAIGLMTSSRSTNEAAYLLQKLFRTRFGTNNVDCCARVCHSSTAAALTDVTGTGAASASFADVELARCLVVAGANATEAHPVVGARILRRARAGVPLLVVDPRRTELAEAASVHLAARPGTNVLLFNALAKILIERGRIDAAYLLERCTGLPELSGFVAGQALDDAVRTTGVSSDALHAAAELLAAQGPPLFVWGLGLSELSQGTASVRGLANLALLCGAPGRPGAGLLPLRGQNNVQGNADMGSQPGQLTGYQDVRDAAVRARFAALWGREPPARAGKTIPEMLEAARAGRLRALWIQGEDVAQSDPDETRVLAGLERLELLVVQELFLTETARRAQLVLPAAGFLEQDGTFTNGERRFQRVRAALPPPGEARPDWEVAVELANALGLGWRYDSFADVLDEIARVAPAVFGGVAAARLEPDGLQWPCPDAGHPGSARLHERAFPIGRARLSCVPYVASPELGVASHPFSLITGRVREHYNVGTMTRRTAQATLATHDRLELHPDDAEALGIASGDRVLVESRHGSTHALAERTRRVAPGTLFLSFHFPETHANRVVGPAHDPESHCPEYKLTAVRVRRAE